MHNLSEVNGQPDAAKPLNTTTLTWAALLGRWIEFARTAVALPDDDTGRCMRASVPDVIMLQAVWFALQHLDDLSSSQRPLGLDRAEILIDKHVERLTRRWAGLRIPPQLIELTDDARKQLAEARSC